MAQMTKYEIKVDSHHAGFVTVASPVELLSVVARIRRIFDRPVVEEFEGETFTYYLDPEEGGIEVSSDPIRTYERGY